jgi:hypothetical protein
VFNNISKIIKQCFKREKYYINLSNSLEQANLESRTIIKIENNKEAIIIKD